MWFPLKAPALLLATIALSYSASPEFPVAQAGADHASPAPRAALTKLFPPTYPPLAGQAMIAGDVKLEVSVHPDGSIESVTLISGHPMLAQAALDSAKKSQFECRGCVANGSLPLTFSFQVVRGEPNPDPCCCTYNPTKPRNDTASTPTLAQTENRVTITITTPRSCACPDACDIKWAEEHSKFRSAKCLFLWKCGRRVVTID